MNDFTIHFGIIFNENWTQAKQHTLPFLLETGFLKQNNFKTTSKRTPILYKIMILVMHYKSGGCDNSCVCDRKKSSLP